MKSHAQGQITSRVDSLVGVSQWVRRIREEIQRVAAHDSGVLITGPSGTGKELIARAVHAHSYRCDAPFVPVDCAALPGELFTSQMFGHMKGAFTGAHYAALGAFRAAEGGTIFLDEIGELEPALQAKLLRTIQERTIIPLGSHQGVPVNVRIIAATNRDLLSEVAQRRFREDLYYRLNVVSLQTAPLAERRADIEPLATHFLHRLSIDNGLPLKRLTPAAVNLLVAYDWPGNVRELYNHLERAVVFAEGDAIEPGMMPQLLDAVLSSGPNPTAPAWDRGEVNRAADVSMNRPATASAELTDEARWPTLADVEREHIRNTLERTRFNQSETSRILGIDRNALRRKMKRYGIDMARSRRGRPSEALREPTAFGVRRPR